MSGEEAVEAAAKYLSELLADYPADYSKEARELLETVAPYLMRTAWDEATNALYMGNAINQDHLKTMWAQNPYRPTA